MPQRVVYRSGVVLGVCFGLLCTKALSATGEHDVWPGTAATIPAADGDPVNVSSSSIQDAPTVTDVWTVTDTGGTDQYYGLDVAGTVHAGTTLPTLATAINLGTKTTWAIGVFDLPTVGEGVDIEIGAAAYQWLRNTEATPDEAAAAIAVVLAADPLYDVAVIGGGSGALSLTAKLPNVATADVDCTITDDGDVAAVAMFAHGPASTTHTAAEAAGTVTITRTVAGVSSWVAADTDNVTAVHAVTGAAGTGIQVLRVVYLNPLGVLVDELLTLAGTTAVPTTDDVGFLLYAEARQVGSAGAAAGTVSLKRTDTTALATIVAGDSETHVVAWKVPSGRRHSVVGILASNGSGTLATLRLRATGPHGSRELWRAALPIASLLQFDLVDMPLQLLAGESLKATLEGNGATVTVSLVIAED